MKPQFFTKDIKHWFTAHWSITTQHGQCGLEWVKLVAAHLKDWVRNFSTWQGWVGSKKPSNPTCAEPYSQHHKVSPFCLTVRKHLLIYVSSIPKIFMGGTYSNMVIVPPFVVFVSFGHENYYSATKIVQNE